MEKYSAASDSGGNVNSFTRILELSSLFKECRYSLSNFVQELQSKGLNATRRRRKEG